MAEPITDEGMLFGFDTDDRIAALAALLVYVTYRSRDVRRLKVTPDLWGKIQRFVKASAKRARSVGEFVEKLKPRLGCSALSPKWMEVGERGALSLVRIEDNEDYPTYVAVAPAESRRPFFTNIIARDEEPGIITRLYEETEWVVILVRERLEREKEIFKKFKIKEEKVQEENAS